jgi:hypothetical protein
VNAEMPRIPRRRLPPPLSRTVRMRLLLSATSQLRVVARLHFDPADPFVVRAVFRSEVDGPVTWLLSRELLAEGVHRPAGAGDVRLWPVSGPDGEGVQIALRSQQGEALLQARRADLVALLARIDAVVPPGSEIEQAQIDEELQALLADDRPDDGWGGRSG